MQEHERDVNQLKDQVLNSEGVVKNMSASNTMRKKNYRRFDLSRLNQVLKVDPSKKIALSEPGVTMEALVDQTLIYGLMPAVLPEFKGITVGGAINGAALESSSHRYGQFNDICKSYEVLLGDGRQIKVSPQENPDLFYGIAGSYGSLGIVTAAEIQLVPAKPYVEVDYQNFSDVQEALDHLKASRDFDYLEAIIYGKNHIVTVVGKGTDSPRYPVFTANNAFSPWFYQHVREAKSPESIPIKDYLFRHDRGAFWMGGYAVSPKMLYYYLRHKFFNWFPTLGDQDLPLEHTLPGHPGSMFRALFGMLMGSKTLYGSLHNGSEDWFEKHFVIQDYYIPERTAAAFVNESIDLTGIVPIWICPITPTKTPQLFSPHYLQNEPFLYDIGIYGHPKNHQKGPQVVKELEKLTSACGGKKMFYCHSYLSLEQFWQIYPFKEYNELRKKYGAEGKLLHITDKIL